MGVASGAVGRWTRAFTVASGLSYVLLGILVAVDAGRVALAVVGLFGFVLPMVFGMAYVLLPPYVGRTFRPAWIPGLHFAATAVGGLGLGWWAVLDGPWVVGRAGVVAWSFGVALFVGGLARVVIPAVRDDPAGVLRLGDRPQRSTRLATVLLPVGLAALLSGTGWLLVAATSPVAVRLALPGVVHATGAGFAALLVFALGARLLRGFFHVDPPRWLAWLVLLPGAVGPLLLAATPAGSGPFVVGGILEAAAMVAYLALVALVAVRTDTRRVGIVGVLLGAVAGVVAAVVALVSVLGPATWLLDLHAVLVLAGFFGLTIVGYAFQFFPVTTGRVPGATRRGALAVFGLLAGGLAGHTAGVLAARPLVAAAGGWVLTAGAAGSLWLVTARFRGAAGR